MAFNRIKSWYRGDPVPYSLQEMMDLQRDRFGEPPTGPLPDRFRQSVSAKSTESIIRLVRKEWKFFILWLTAATLTNLGLYLTSVAQALPI